MPLCSSKHSWKQFGWVDNVLPSPMLPACLCLCVFVFPFPCLSSPLLVYLWCCLPLLLLILLCSCLTPFTDACLSVWSLVYPVPRHSPAHLCCCLFLRCPPFHMSIRNTPENYCLLFPALDMAHISPSSHLHIRICCSREQRRQKQDCSQTGNQARRLGKKITSVTYSAVLLAQRNCILLSYGRDGSAGLGLSSKQTCDWNRGVVLMYKHSQWGKVVTGGKA